MEVNNRASGWTVVYKHSYIDEMENIILLDITEMILC